MTKPETDLQKTCVDYLKKKKIYHVNIHGGGWSAKGAPDLIACIDGKFIAFELKVGKNNMQDDQEIHAIRIKRNGGLHYSPYTFEEFVQIVEDIKNGKI